jgi:serine/threonine protein kinase
MAPERFSKRTAVEPASDVYSLGCTLYEGLAGSKLHRDSDAIEIMRLASNSDAHAEFVADRSRDLPEGCGPELCHLLRSMLAFSPNGRPTAAEVERECEQLDDRLPGSRTRGWCRDHAW